MKLINILLFKLSVICFLAVCSYAQSATYKVGDLVEAADYRGVWYKSKIVDVRNDKYKAHYIGWDSDWDEWVTADKIRFSNDPDFGREFEVEQNGNWYKATIADTRYGTETLVTYSGYDEDEWVKNERIRDFYGRVWNPGKIGRTVNVLFKKKLRRATIINERPGEFYVHYDGSTDVWNEWVKADLIREL